MQLCAGGSNIDRDIYQCHYRYNITIYQYHYLYLLSLSLSISLSIQYHYINTISLSINITINITINTISLSINITINTISLYINITIYQYNIPIYPCLISTTITICQYHYLSIPLSIYICYLHHFHYHYLSIPLSITINHYHYLSPSVISRAVGAPWPRLHAASDDASWSLGPKPSFLFSFSTLGVFVLCRSSPDALGLTRTLRERYDP